MAAKVEGARDKNHVACVIGRLEASGGCNSFGKGNPLVGVALAKLGHELLRWGKLLC